MTVRPERETLEARAAEIYAEWEHRMEAVGGTPESSSRELASALAVVEKERDQLQEALTELKRRDYGGWPHGDHLDPRSTVRVIDDALADAPARPIPGSAEWAAEIAAAADARLAEVAERYLRAVQLVGSYPGHEEHVEAEYVEILGEKDDAEEALEDALAAAREGAT